MFNICIEVSAVQSVSNVNKDLPLKYRMMLSCIISRDSGTHRAGDNVTILGHVSDW